MPLVIRKVDRKPLWDRNTSLVQPWLSVDDLAADALHDLRTKENRLSVYIIDSLTQPTLDRLLAAMAACRDVLDKIDYAVFDSQLLAHIDIRLELTKGETPDDEVNDWHHDLVELTASKLATLGTTMKQHGKVLRKYPKDVLDLVQRGVGLGQIDRSRLKQGLATKIV